MNMNSESKNRAGEAIMLNHIGIPILSYIPIIGSLFRRSVTSKTKSELMVLVTPHIITDAYLDAISPTVNDFEKKAEGRDAQLIH